MMTIINKLIQDVGIPFSVQCVIIAVLAVGPLIGVYLQFQKWVDRPQKYTRIKDRMSILESLESRFEEMSDTLKKKAQSELESILRYTIYETKITKEAFELLAPLEQNGVISAYALKQSLIHQKMKDEDIVFFKGFDWFLLYYYKFNMFVLFIFIIYLIILDLGQLIHGQGAGVAVGGAAVCFILAIMIKMTLGSIVYARKIQKLLDSHSKRGQEGMALT